MDELFRKHEEKDWNPKQKQNTWQQKNGNGSRWQKQKKKQTKRSIKQKATGMYLILPSYPEKHQAEVNKIIAREKSKLCSNSHFRTIFENVNFKIAFSNSRNMKKMLVRTKL